MSHSARSAWIETTVMTNTPKRNMSRTPQGVRGLKQRIQGQGFTGEPSRTPQGVRGLKHLMVVETKDAHRSHSARSAWIETSSKKPANNDNPVALRKECVD